MENQGYPEAIEGAYARMRALPEDPDRPAYHLSPLAGTLADPNGLVQIGDTYHIMHLNNPLACETAERTACVWAHWTTRDFVAYRREPVALYPDAPFDRDGVYSGSALARGYQLYLFYTGNVRHHGDFDYVHAGREQNVVRAASSGGVQFGEKRLLMTNADFPADMTRHVRDPQMIDRGSDALMLLGARTAADTGCVLVYRTEDLEHFSLVNTVSTPEKFGYMWECPDLAELGGRSFLLCCPQGIAHEERRYQNEHQCGYFALEGDLAADARVGAFEQWDYGFDFYAARTLKSSDGRVLLVGWLGMAEASYGSTPSARNGWDQVLAMPRELELVGSRIYQRPLAELAGLRGREVAIDGAQGFRAQARRFRMELLPRAGSPVRVRLREDAELAYDSEKRELSLVMGEVCGVGRDVRRLHLDELAKLEIYVDGSVLEVFANDGYATMTSRLFGCSERTAVDAFDGTGSFCQMGSFVISEA